VNLAPTTIVLWTSEPDPHAIRLHDLTTLSDFWADARASVVGQASLRAGATFRANAIASISTTPRLNTRSLFSAAATVSLATQAPLTVQHRLKARPVLSLATQAPLTIIPLLKAAPQLRLLTTSPRLSLGGLPLRAQPGLRVTTSRPFLSRTAQHFASSSSLALRTNANLVVLGRGATSVLITFNGVEADNVRLNSLIITDTLNEQPNTASFVVDARTGQPPGIGTVVRIGLRDLTPLNVIFAGTVKRSQQYYEGKPSNPAWRIDCEDFTFLLNRRRVFGTWTKVSASQVATDIVTRFTSGFSTGGIVGGLPAITVTFNGETVMDALTQVANLAGAYAGGPDYNRVVYLFVTDPRGTPTVITPTNHLLALNTPIQQTLDVTQTRTRVDVQGASTSVGGPAEFTIGPEYGQLPLAESKIFTPGTGGQVLTEDAQIVSYSDVSPGGLPTIVRGNVSPPGTAPLAAIAAGVAGGLQGSGYQWKIVFANDLGETEPGPPSSPPLSCAAFPAPAPPIANPIAVSPLVDVGPLIGTYRYACSFVTSKGETLIGPQSSATAAPVVAAFAGGGESARAGPLLPGQTYGYAVAFTTILGETEAGGAWSYTPSALPMPQIYNLVQNDFGGLQGNSDYLYGVTLVTRVGESAIVWWSIHTFSNSGTPGNPVIQNADFNGRIAAGSYAWACSYYSDAFGETFLSSSVFGTAGTPPPGSSGTRVLLALPGLSVRADGLRLYRAIQGQNWQLAFDERRGNTFTSVWDSLPQSECGNPWPNHPLRGGGISTSFRISSSAAPDVIARRVYRSKANGSELFLLAEIQNNDDVGWVDAAFDTALTVRNPIVATTGRAAVVNLPPAPFVPSTGYVGRRIYRTKANSPAYFRVVEIQEMTSTSYLDITPDASLTGVAPVAPSTAGGCVMDLVSIPIGPTGTLARRLYRTTGNGTQLRFLAEIGDNVTTRYRDAIADANLSTTLAPLVNKAGAAAVQLTQIPTGGASVTQRLVYRNKALGPDLQPTAFQYVDTIKNNVDTTFIDDKADADLGRLPVSASTIGALAGDTSVMVTSAAGWPNSGWFNAASQTVRYNGISVSPFQTGDTLQNIPPLLEVSSLTRSGQTAIANTVFPHGFKLNQRVVILGAVQPEYTGTRDVTAVPSATQFYYLVNGAPASPATAAPGQKIYTSAPGALVAPVAGGTAILSVPMLTGVSGIGVPLPVGSSLALWVVCDSAAGQQALINLEGADGVHEFVVTDSTLKTVADCLARGQAELALFQYVIVDVEYVTRDRLTRSGALVTINLPPPQNLNGSYRIQEVRIDQIDTALRTFPRYTVRCSSSKFSLTDVLRHLVLKEDIA